MKKPSLTSIHYFAIGALLLVPILATNLTPNIYEGGRSRDEFDRELRNSSAIANILGEVRANVSDLMFIKTERYLHAGVAYAAHIDMERVASTGEIAHRDTEPPTEMSFAQGIREHESEIGVAPEEGEEEGEAATLIPAANSDFRGFIGHLHRRVKPWQDPSIPHTHTTGKELLPWYRLMTFSDPTNVRAYLMGAWWLKSKREEAFYREALDFINEGIRFNPGAFQLFLLKADLVELLGDEDQALALYHQAADMGLRARPEGVDVTTNEFRRTAGGIIWTYYMEEDLRRATRTSVLTERNRGNIKRAIQLGLEYQERFKGEDDFALTRILNEMKSSDNP